MAWAAAAVAAVSVIQQAGASSEAAKYNAQVAQQNAIIAQQQGAASNDILNRNIERAIGSQVASYGASGVGVTSGSPLDVLADTAATGALDKLTNQYNYALKGMGYTEQAALDNTKAVNDSTAGVLGAANAAFNGYTTYTKYFGSGIPNFSGGQTWDASSTQT